MESIRLPCLLNDYLLEDVCKHIMRLCQPSEHRLRRWNMQFVERQVCFVSKCIHLMIWLVIFMVKKQTIAVSMFDTKLILQNKF